MPFIILRGERNLVELADRLFVDLTPQERTRAESVLMRNNPILRDPNKFVSGLIVKVPSLPELRAKARPEKETASTRLAHALTAALDAADTALADAMTAELEGVRQGTETLDALLRASAATSNPDLMQTAQIAAEGLAQREKQLRQRNETLFRAVQLIRQDLSAQAKLGD